MGFWGVVVNDAAEVEFRGVDGVLLWVARERLAVGANHHALGFKFLRAREGADELAHEVGEAEDGDEEEEEGLLGGAGGGWGAVGESCGHLTLSCESGKCGWGE